MGDEDEIEVEAEALSSNAVPFLLQFDKSIQSQVKIAEWNPEKDLLAMVTEDSKILLHRFNWQRLWTISPGKCVTSLCWRPDGKAIALGLEDGSISLHDVENGKLLRNNKTHSEAVVCLNWEEDAQLMKDNDNSLVYEDRTMRFFPPPPRVPRMPGLVSGDSGLADDPEDSFQELSSSSRQRFNVLCSGDKNGCICFSIFGIFPIGKINIQKIPLSSPFLDGRTRYQLLNASIHKVALSKNLCQLAVLSFGDLVKDFVEGDNKVINNEDLVQLDKSSFNDHSLVGLHCLLLNTSIFLNRKNELHQVAQQASSIEDLFEVIRCSLSVMLKHWSGAMNSFHEKFDPLASLIDGHGLDSSPQDEFLSLLFGARTSPPLHQFLVNSLGETGLRRVSKAIDSAGRELHLIVREHLQPAVEIIGFRIGELRGLSRWRARYQNIGLDEKLIENATEKAGMCIVHVERFLRVLAIVTYQFQNFFNWLSKCIKILQSEQTDQIQPPNSELVVIFLKFLLDHDPVGQLLESEVRHNIEVDMDTMQRIEQLVEFGGFSDTKYLERTLANEFNQMENCFKEAFSMPFSTVSRKINCESLLPLYPASSSSALSSHTPASIAFYEVELDVASVSHTSRRSLVDYICFKIPDGSLDMTNCIGILRGLTCSSSPIQKGVTSLEAVLLCIPKGYHCVDLSLYKDNQIVLLLNEASPSSESPGRSWMMMVETSDVPFVPVSSPVVANFWELQKLKDSTFKLDLDDGKVRCIPHSVVNPLAVSASRGVACVFSSRRHALVYILDEDEEEASDTD